jgi:DNA-3-methyladenine glycosylase II
VQGGKEGRVKAAVAPRTPSTTSQLTRRLAVRGPFELGQALAFLRGFLPAGGSDPGPPGCGPGGTSPGGDRYRAAHVIGGRALGIELSQDADGLLLSPAAAGASAAQLFEAEELVRRVFSLDLDGTAFQERVGKGDQVMAGLQRRFPGLRPVLFATPFEALCWAVLSQRTRMSHAAHLRSNLVAALGPKVTVDGGELTAFPAPEALLAAGGELTGVIGLPVVKAGRLQRLAERAAGGDFEPRRLLEMSDEQARDWLEQSPGIGAWTSEFVLIRGIGRSDLLPRGEWRLLSAVQRYYGLAGRPSFDELEGLSRGWEGFRSWAAFLLRAALHSDTRGTGASGGPARSPARSRVGGRRA